MGIINNNYYFVLEQVPIDISPIMIIAMSLLVVLYALTPDQLITVQACRRELENRMVV